MTRPTDELRALVKRLRERQRLHFFAAEMTGGSTSSRERELGVECGEAAAAIEEWIAEREAHRKLMLAVMMSDDCDQAVLDAAEESHKLLAETQKSPPNPAKD